MRQKLFEKGCHEQISMNDSNVKMWFFCIGFVLFTFGNQKAKKPKQTNNFYSMMLRPKFKFSLKLIVNGVFGGGHELL